MNEVFSSAYVNRTYIDIFITPFENFENEVERNVNLTWNVTSFADKRMLVQLNFSNPLMISNGMRYDSINVHVINFADIFVSSNGLMLSYESKNMTSKIKKQMFNTEATRAYLKNVQTSKSMI